MKLLFVIQNQNNYNVKTKSFILFENSPSLLMKLKFLRVWKWLIWNWRRFACYLK